MTALPGGAADKIGNQFEAWWTLYRVSSLLRGKAARMRLEPPAGEGEGIEFWVEEDGVRWCEQVKHVPSTVKWTIGALKARKVLSRVQSHLSNGHNVRLVLSTPADDLSYLSSHARNANSLHEFRAIIRRDLESHFEALATHWGVSELTAWSHLRGLYVEQHTEHDLEPLVRAQYERLLTGNPEVVMSELSDWLVSKLHQTVTGPEVWAHLQRQGFDRRYLAGDPGTLESLLATLARHHRRISQLKPAFSLVDPARAEAVINWCVEAETSGQQILLLHGEAGSGKSTLVDSVLKQLAEMGWFCGILSMDKTPAGVFTSSALGKSASLPGSPAVLLAGISDGSPAVLFIDQLDAVATYSGRMQDNYDSVDDVLSEAGANPNLRLVLVVRTVDLDQDPRLSRLRADRERVNEMALERYTPAQVEDALERSGIAPSSLDATTLRLLEVPLHYAIFSQLDVSNRSDSYSTLPDLYRSFTDQIVRKIRARIGTLNWASITGAMANYMSEKETLRAPVAVLRQADIAEVEALLSSGVLYREHSGVSFFHETYFDFLFAEAFVADGRNLVQFLLESGQALFRRAQARQILEYLAKTNHGDFMSTVVNMLSSQSIRSHLLDVPLSLLRQWDAAPQDWQALKSLALGNTRRSRQLLGLLSLPSWFDAADVAGDWEWMLADQDKLPLVANQLISAARDRPDRVAQLIRPHVGGSESWKAICTAVFAWSLSPGLAPFAIELLEAGQVDGVRGPIAVNSDFWSVLYSLSEEAPEAAANVTGAYLRRAAVLAASEGIFDPFESSYLPNSSSSGGEEVISRIASGAPEQFIAQVLPFVKQVLKETMAAQADEIFLRRRRWQAFSPGEPHGIDRALFHGLETALRAYPAEKRPELLDLLRPLMSSNFEELRFLCCRALAAHSLANESIEWLISDPRNLEMGYMASPRWASRELIQSASKDCLPGLLEKLSKLLLSYFTDYEKSPRGRAAHGYAQFELLSGIDSPRRSETVNRRLQELERKFGEHRPSAPRPITADFVGPPVPEPAGGLLTDANWMAAIQAHDSNTVNWSDPIGPKGGSHELSGLIGRRAAEEPARFARLGLGLNASQSVHLGSIIRSVAGRIPIDDLEQLCKHAFKLAKQDLGRDICWAVDEVAAEATDGLVDLVVSCSSDADPTYESARTVTGSGDVYYGGDLSSAGLNSTRGAAAGCLASILFNQPHRSSQLLATVQKLAQDPIMAVKVRAADAILALLNTMPEEALRIAGKMFETSWIDIFDARETSELLRHGCLRNPKYFATHLHRALTANDATAKRAGYVWIVAFINGALDAPAPLVLSELSSAAREGVAKALAASPGVATETLIDLLNDDDSDVRQAAAAGLRHVHELDQRSLDVLVTAFSQSRAFKGHMEGLFSSLNRATLLLPPSTIKVCELAVTAKGEDLAELRLDGAVVSRHLIAVVLRLYKQGTAEVRGRCLDIIDNLSDLGAYGLEAALSQERL